MVGAQGSRHDLCLMAAPAIYMNHYVCFDYVRPVAFAEEARQHIAEVLDCVNVFRRDYCSIKVVRHPLHFFLFAHAMAGSKDSRAWRVGLGANIKW